MRRLAPLLCALALSAPAAAQEAADRPTSRIVVMGEGRVAGAPDMATLRMGVQAEAPRAEAALDAASEAAGSLIEALRGAGVAEADLQTSELTLGPRYEVRGDADAIVAYVASNVVTARLRDLRAMGDVMAAASEAGANRIDGLSFELSDPDAAMAEARGRAVEDARAAAETLAEAAGGSLGPVLRIEEGTSRATPQPYAALDRAEVASVPIAQGEVETVATVRMVFRLEATGD